MCNTAIYFLHRRLRYKDYKFIASQSKIGEEYIKENNLGKIYTDSFVLLKGSEVYTKSDAMLKIVDDMSYKWTVFKIFKLVPRIIRNWGYDQISKNRHLFFGRSN